MDQLISYLNPVLQSSVRSRFALCWRASADGWLSSTFHSYCDGKGPTVTIIRVGSYIFGGYTDASWTSSKYYRSGHRDITCRSSGRRLINQWYAGIVNYLLNEQLDGTKLFFTVTSRLGSCSCTNHRIIPFWGHAQMLGRFNAFMTSSLEKNKGKHYATCKQLWRKISLGKIVSQTEPQVLWL